MLKPILSLLLFLPVLAWANCGFSHEDDTMTIVVGSKTNKCFSSVTFRDAFRANLVAAVEAMDDGEARTVRDADSQQKRFDDRNARAAKLWTIAERRFQASSPSGRYYGERR